MSVGSCRIHAQYGLAHEPGRTNPGSVRSSCAISFFQRSVRENPVMPPRTRTTAALPLKDIDNMPARAATRTGKAGARSSGRDLEQSLASLTVKVDDLTAGKAVVSKKLEALGASVKRNLQGNLSHVVFVREKGQEERDAKRLQHVLAYKRQHSPALEVVSVGWVEACEKAGSWVGEAGYRLDDEGVEGKKRGVPPRLVVGAGEGGHDRKKVRRAGSSKALTPRAMETLVMDEDKLDSSRRLRARGGGFREAAAVVEKKENKKDSKRDTKKDTKKGVTRATRGAGKKRAATAVEIDDEDALETSLEERVSRRVSAGGEKKKKGSMENKANIKKAAKAEKKAQPAVRFSTRCLTVYPERPVKLDKTLPEGPVEAKKILKATAGGAHAPIPEIKRVESPWGTPQTTSRLPVGVIGNLDLRTVSKANVRDATASTRKLIKEVPSPWSVVRVYDSNVPRDTPGSVGGGGTGGPRRSLLGGGLQAQTPMSSQPLRMNRAQVQSLRMSIQRHERAGNPSQNGSQNASPNPSPLVLMGGAKKSGLGVGPSGLGPLGAGQQPPVISSQVPPMFADDVVTQEVVPAVERDAAEEDGEVNDGDVNDEYGTQVTESPADKRGVPTQEPAAPVQPTQEASLFSKEPTIYYTAQDAATQATQGLMSQQMTQPLTAANISQLQAAMQPPPPRLSQEILTIPTPSQISVVSDEETEAPDKAVLPSAPTTQPSLPCSQETSTQPDAKTGTIAFTSVSQSVLESCKVASASLPGLTLWSNTSRKSASAPITHLIIGDNRRYVSIPP